MLFAARGFGQDSRTSTASKSLSVSATDSRGNPAGTVTVVLSCNAFGLHINATLNPASGVELQQNEPDKRHVSNAISFTVPK